LDKLIQKSSHTPETKRHLFLINIFSPVNVINHKKFNALLLIGFTLWNELPQI